MLLPDIGNACGDPSLQWRVWLALQQLSMAALCTLAFTLPRTKAVTTMLVATALWYAVQAVDELVAGNFFDMGLWEYPLMAVYATAIALYLRRHDREIRET